MEPVLADAIEELGRSDPDTQLMIGNLKCREAAGSVRSAEKAPIQYHRSMVCSAGRHRTSSRVFSVVASLCSPSSVCTYAVSSKDLLVNEAGTGGKLLAGKRG